MGTGRAYGDARVGADTGAGDDDHLPGFGEGVGDILEQVEGVGRDLEGGHGSIWRLDGTRSLVLGAGAGELNQSCNSWRLLHVKLEQQKRIRSCPVERSAEAELLAGSA